MSLVALLSSCSAVFRAEVSSTGVKWKFIVSAVVNVSVITVIVALTIAIASIVLLVVTVIVMVISVTAIVSSVSLVVAV